jgi:hypothetical protein
MFRIEDNVALLTVRIAFEDDFVVILELQNGTELHQVSFLQPSVRAERGRRMRAGRAGGGRTSTLLGSV